MQKGTWITGAVCGLLGGCADLALLFQPSPPMTLTSVETIELNRVQESTVGASSSRRMVRSSRPALAQTTPASRDDPLTTGATGSSSSSPAASLTPPDRVARVRDEWLSQRERAAKRALSGICTGC